MSTTARWKRQEREITKTLGTNQLASVGTSQAGCRIDGVAYQVQIRSALPPA